MNRIMKTGDCKMLRKILRSMGKLMYLILLTIFTSSVFASSVDSKVTEALSNWDGKDVTVLIKQIKSINPNKGAIKSIRAASKSNNGKNETVDKKIKLYQKKIRKKLLEVRTNYLKEYYRENPIKARSLYGYGDIGSWASGGDIGAEADFDWSLFGVDSTVTKEVSDGCGRELAKELGMSSSSDKIALFLAKEFDIVVTPEGHEEESGVYGNKASKNWANRNFKNFTLITPDGKIKKYQGGDVIAERANAQRMAKIRTIMSSGHNGDYNLLFDKHGNFNLENQKKLTRKGRKKLHKLLGELGMSQAKSTTASGGIIEMAAHLHHEVLSEADTMEATALLDKINKYATRGETMKHLGGLSEEAIDSDVVLGKHGDHPALREAYRFIMKYKGLRKEKLEQAYSEKMNQEKIKQLGYNVEKVLKRLAVIQFQHQIDAVIMTKNQAQRREKINEIKSAFDANLPKKLYPEFYNEIFKTLQKVETISNNETQLKTIQKAIKNQRKLIKTERRHARAVEKLNHFLDKTFTGRKILAIKGEIEKVATKYGFEPNDTPIMGFVEKFKSAGKHTVHYLGTATMFIGGIEAIQSAETDTDMAIALGHVWATSTTYGMIASETYNAVSSGDFTKIGSAAWKVVALALVPEVAIPDLMKTLGLYAGASIKKLFFDDQMEAFYVMSNFYDKKRGKEVCEEPLTIEGQSVENLIKDIYDNSASDTILSEIHEDALKKTTGENEVSWLKAKVVQKSFTNLKYYGEAAIFPTYGPLVQITKTIKNFNDQIDAISKMSGAGHSPMLEDTSSSWTPNNKLNRAEVSAIRKLLQARENEWKKIEPTLAKAIILSFKERCRAEKELNKGKENAQKLLDELLMIFEKLSVKEPCTRALEEDGKYTRIKYLFSTDKDVQMKAMKAVLKYKDAYSAVLLFREITKSKFQKATGRELFPMPMNGWPALVCKPEVDIANARKLLSGMTEARSEIKELLETTKKYKLKIKDIALDREYGKCEKNAYRVLLGSKYQQLYYGILVANYDWLRINKHNRFEIYDKSLLSSKASDKLDLVSLAITRYRQALKDYKEKCFVVVNQKNEQNVSEPFIEDNDTETVPPEDIVKTVQGSEAQDTNTSKNSQIVQNTNKKVDSKNEGTAKVATGKDTKAKEGKEDQKTKAKADEKNVTTKKSGNKKKTKDKLPSSGLDIDITKAIKTAIGKITKTETVMLSSTPVTHNFKMKIEPGNIGSVPQYKAIPLKIIIDGGKGPFRVNWNCSNKVVGYYVLSKGLTGYFVGKSPGKSTVHICVSDAEAKNAEATISLTVKPSNDKSLTYISPVHYGDATGFSIDSVNVKKDGVSVASPIYEETILFKDYTKRENDSWHSYSHKFKSTKVGVTEDKEYAGIQFNALGDVEMWYEVYEKNRHNNNSRYIGDSQHIRTTILPKDNSPIDLNETLGEKPIKKPFKKEKLELTLKVVSKNKVLLGEEIKIKAKVNGGIPPYRYNWSGAEGGKEVISFKATKAGTHKISVKVTDANKSSVEKSINIIVEAPKFTITGLQSKNLYSSKTTLKINSNSDMSKNKPIWQSDKKGILFNPPEGIHTSVTFANIGDVNIWAYTVGKKGKVSLESKRVHTKVTIPNFSLKLKEETPLVGAEDSVIISTQAKIDNEYFRYRWLPMGKNVQMLGESDKGRSYRFKMKNTNKTILNVLVWAQPYAEKQIANLKQMISAKTYEISISKPKRLDKAPWRWDPKQGKAVELPQAIAVFQNAEVHCKITPKPKEKVKYQWMVSPEGCTVSAPMSKSTYLNTHETGSYTAFVEVKDKNNVVLGKGSTTFTVTVSQRDLDVAKQKAKDQKKAKESLQKSRNLWKEGKLQRAIAKVSQGKKLAGKNKEISKTLKAMQRQKKELDAKLDKASNLIKNGKLKDAETILSQAARISDKYKRHKEVLKQLTDVKKKAKEKEKQITKLLKDAKVLKNAGKLNEAVTILKKGSGNKKIDKLLREVKTQQNVAHKKMTEGQRQWKNGVLDKAVYTLNEAAEIDPSNRQITKVLKGMESQKKMMDNALKKADELISQKKFKKAQSTLVRAKYVSRNYPRYVTIVKKLASAEQDAVITAEAEKKRQEAEKNTQETTKKVSEQPTSKDLAYTESFAGKWNSTYGVMTLTVQGLHVSGSYTHDKGRIDALLSQDAKTMRGSWAEAPSYKGSRDAGKMYFKLSSDGKKIDGLWSYGDAVPTSRWMATRIIDTQHQATEVVQPKPNIVIGGLSQSGNNPDNPKKMIYPPRKITITDINSYGVYPEVGILEGGRYIVKQQNGTFSHYVIKQFDSTGIHISRIDISGRTKGMKAEYIGKIIDNESASGTAIWTWKNWKKPLNGKWKASWKHNKSVSVDTQSGYITIISATYGANCGISSGNATPYIAKICNGKSSCRYTVDYKKIGDPAIGCRKTYSVQYRCGNNPQVFKGSLAAEAGWGDKSILLDCRQNNQPEHHTPPSNISSLVGSWKWFDGETIHIYPNGTATDGFKGKWQANLNGSGFTYTINWNNGQYIDSLVLHGDTLDGHNQNGTHVWGKRIISSQHNETIRKETRKIQEEKEKNDIVSINNPKVNGVALDYCRDWGNNCGKPAADAWCQTHGYNKSISYVLKNDTPPTRIISTGKICKSSFCDRIVEIKCRQKVTEERKVQLKNNVSSSSKSKMRYRNASGKWYIDGDKAVLTHIGNKIKGSYAYSNGKVYGTVQGNIWNGFWTQDESNQHCNVSKYGSFYWGRFHLIFNNRFEKLSGEWSYCNNMPDSRKWKGERRYDK